MYLPLFADCKAVPGQHSFDGAQIDPFKRCAFLECHEAPRTFEHAGLDDVLETEFLHDVDQFRILGAELIDRMIYIDGLNCECLPFIVCRDQ